MGELLGLPSVDPADALIGARVRRWRDHRAVTLEALAQALSLSPARLRQVEAGRARLDSLQIAAATAHLHLPLWALVSDRPAY